MGVADDGGGGVGQAGKKRYEIPWGYKLVMWGKLKPGCVKCQ